ncbi:MAG: hypothetical protein AAB608_02655 [Patescibacteria group bacterium]
MYTPPREQIVQWAQLHERKVAGILILFAAGIVLALALSGARDVALEVERGSASIPDTISLTNLIDPVVCTVTSLTETGDFISVTAEASEGNGSFTWYALGGTPETGTGNTFTTTIDTTTPGYGLLLISGDVAATSIPTRTDACQLTP